VNSISLASSKKINNNKNKKNIFINNSLSCFFNQKKMQTKLISKSRHYFSSIPRWATCDPFSLSESKPYTLENLSSGKWKGTKEYTTTIDPMNG